MTVSLMQQYLMCHSRKILAGMAGKAGLARVKSVLGLKGDLVAQAGPWVALTTTGLEKQR